MKKATFFTALIASAIFASCSDHGSGATPTATITGYVAEVSSYGQIVPNFTPADMKKAGFEYADLIHATIGDNIDIDNIPFITSFNEAGILEIAYVDYNAAGNDYGFGMLNGNFYQYMGGEAGDKITITLSKKAGYKEQYEILKSVYPVERRSGETAEEYANFRMIQTTGIAPNTIYRSSNPLNSVKNPGRYRVVDSLAQVVGIKAEIDLADTQTAIEGYMASEGYASTHCPELFRQGNVIACGLDANCFSSTFKAKIGEAIKFMIAHEPPYLIHCNEGKDRCGFVSMLFEALTGANVSELRNDYMVTMKNFYKTTEGSTEYNLRQNIAIDRQIWLFCNEEALNDFKNIDWNNINVDNISTLELQAAAKKYIKECGVSNEECATLIGILTGK